MATLRWDQVGERFYETGIDRGVLYLADDTGVAWSGLTGVTESFSGDASEPSYYDGVKNRDTPHIGDFEATLTAYTYPDEFLEYEGVVDLGNGLYVDDQTTKPFGLSYRTKIGNDLEGVQHGYRIHLLYNLTAVPDSSSYETLSDSPSFVEFSWKLDSIPRPIEGYRPTAHIMLDTRFISRGLLRNIETILYGSHNTTPRLPTIDDLVDLIIEYDPRTIVPNAVTGLAALEPGEGLDLTPGSVEGVYVQLPTSRLKKYEVEGFYILTPIRPPENPRTGVDAGGPSTVFEHHIVAGGPTTANPTRIYGGTP